MTQVSVKDFDASKLSFGDVLKTTNINYVPIYYNGNRTWVLENANMYREDTSKVLNASDLCRNNPFGIDPFGYVKDGMLPSTQDTYTLDEVITCASKGGKPQEDLYLAAIEGIIEASKNYILDNWSTKMHADKPAKSRAFVEGKLEELSIPLKKSKERVDSQKEKVPVEGKYTVSLKITRPRQDKKAKSTLVFEASLNKDGEIMDAKTHDKALSTEVEPMTNTKGFMKGCSFQGAFTPIIWFRPDGKSMGIKFNSKVMRFIPNASKGSQETAYNFGVGATTGEVDLDASVAAVSLSDTASEVPSDSASEHTHQTDESEEDINSDSDEGSDDDSPAPTPAKAPVAKKATK